MQCTDKKERLCIFQNNKTGWNLITFLVKITIVTIVTYDHIKFHEKFQLVDKCYQWNKRFIPTTNQLLI